MGDEVPVNWTVDSVRGAPDRQAWVLAYLSVPAWENAGLLRRVRAYGSVWEGPDLVPLAPLIRIAGPGKGYLFPQEAEDWHRRVKAMIASDLHPRRIPPLILWRTECGLQIADGNHRADALIRCGHSEAWALISPYPLREGARQTWEADRAARER